MAELIQFPCPVCGTTLRLPLSMAAQQGPCPTCHHEIVAPDPHRGIGAHEPPQPPQPILVNEPEPFRPFAESPPVVSHVAEPHHEPSWVAPIIPEPSPPQRQAEVQAAGHTPKTVLLLSCLLSGAVALAMGYAIGVRSTQHFMKNQPLSPPAIPLQKTVLVPLPEHEPTPIVVKPIIQKSAETVAEKVKVSAAAEASLRAFLEAPDWAARSSYVLFAKSVRPEMEKYSREVPDGPTAFKSISVKQSQTDEKTGYTLFIFQVETEKFPAGIPVAVVETAQGWLVDWRTFVEFRDDLFKKFADGPINQTERFHLIVTQPAADRAANTENEFFMSFLLDPPFPGRKQLAFASKSTEAFATCQAATADGRIFTPVLELTKRQAPDGKGYLEIAGVTATDWLPREK